MVNVPEEGSLFREPEGVWIAKIWLNVKSGDARYRYSNDAWQVADAAESGQLRAESEWAPLGDHAAALTPQFRRLALALAFFKDGHNILAGDDVEVTCAGPRRVYSISSTNPPRWWYRPSDAGDVRVYTRSSYTQIEPLFSYDDLSKAAAELDEQQRQLQSPPATPVRLAPWSTQGVDSPLKLQQIDTMRAGQTHMNKRRGKTLTKYEEVFYVRPTKLLQSYPRKNFRHMDAYITEQTDNFLLLFLNTLRDDEAKNREKMTTAFTVLGIQFWNHYQAPRSEGAYPRTDDDTNLAIEAMLLSKKYFWKDWSDALHPRQYGKFTTSYKLVSLGDQARDQVEEYTYVSGVDGFTVSGPGGREKFPGLRWDLVLYMYDEAAMHANGIQYKLIWHKKNDVAYNYNEPTVIVLGLLLYDVKGDTLEVNKPRGHRVSLIVYRKGDKLHGRFVDSSGFLSTRQMGHTADACLKQAARLLSGNDTLELDSAQPRVYMDSIHDNTSYENSYGECVQLNYLLLGQMLLDIDGISVAHVGTEDAVNVGKSLLSHIHIIGRLFVWLCYLCGDSFDHATMATMATDVVAYTDDIMKGESGAPAEFSKVDLWDKTTTWNRDRYFYPSRAAEVRAAIEGGDGGGGPMGLWPGFDPISALQRLHI